MLICEGRGISGAGIRNSGLCIHNAIIYSGIGAHFLFFFLMFSGNSLCIVCDDCMKPHQVCLAAAGEGSPETVKYLNTAVRSH